MVRLKTAPLPSKSANKNRFGMKGVRGDMLQFQKARDDFFQWIIDQGLDEHVKVSSIGQSVGMIFLEISPEAMEAIKNAPNLSDLIPTGSVRARLMEEKHSGLSKKAGK